jgi:peroxiredoxin
VIAVDLSRRVLPSLSLPSTHGGFSDTARLGRTAVLVLYPYTGRPGVPDPPGWDHVPGAHGSSPQLRAYNSLHAEFEERGASIWGISLNSPGWQTEFAAREGLRFALLSDACCKLTAALQLATFRAGDIRFLARRTLIVSEGMIVHDRQQIDRPEADAAEALEWLHGSAA